MSRLSAKFKDVSISVYILVILFSMSSWLDVVGVWVEMPLLTSVLPEGWNLPSYLAVIIQLANVGPASYAIINKIRGTNTKTSEQSTKRAIDIEVLFSFIIIFTAGLSVLLMSFQWHKTAWMFGSERSVALLILMLFTSLSSCSSSVIFLPYMARFATSYLSAYYVGQGFSGFIPGLLGLIQGIGKFECVMTNVSMIAGNQSELYAANSTTIEKALRVTVHYWEPKFSTGVFFICLTVLFVISGIAFYVLNFSQIGIAAMVKRKDAKIEQSNGYAIEESKKDYKLVECNGQTPVMLNGTKNDLNSELHLVHEIGSQDQVAEVVEHALVDKPSDTSAKFEKQEKVMSQSTFLTLLLIIGVMSALSNGLLPSTQSYTCLPYGSLVYTLALRLSSVAGPLASLSSMILPKPTTRVVFTLALIGASIAAFHVTLAAQSPNPILRGHVAGEVLVIVSSIVMSICFSYVRVSVAMLLHQAGGRRKLLWCGGVTQVGSFCGAVVAFVLVSILHVFKSRKPCQ